VAVVLKSSKEIEKMRRAGQVVREVLELVRGLVKPGATTLDLEKAAEARTKALGAKAGLQGLPRFSLRAVHLGQQRSGARHSVGQAGPQGRGDRFGRLWGIVEGYCGDAAITVPVGEKIDPEDGAADEGDRGFAARGNCVVKPGATLGDVGFAVQKVVEAEGFSVVRDFVGHGIGVHMHEDPQVPNFGEAGRGMKLRAGMVIAIEPMVNAGKPDVVVLGDGWTAVTADGSMSAHFEHSVAVTATGARILTE
jgi:methionyl aminopeptidase